MADKQSREVIGGKRKCGKTTELIRRAFIDQLYILCANKEMARHIAGRAEEMDLNIPYPITIEDLPLETPYVNRVLVDEAEMVLQSLIGKPVEAMSTSMKMNEMPSLRKGKEQTNGNKSRVSTFNNIERIMEERHRFDDVIQFIRENDFRFNLMDVDDIQIASVISVYKELEKSPTSSKSIGSLHVDIDCSDALKGLKAVQREARKATRSLRELEEQQNKVSYGCDCNA